MKIIFLGSSEFATPALSRIISSGHEVVCVVTQPDRLKGRGLVVSATEVKKLAQANKLKIFQPENINSRESINFLKDLNPDVFVVVAFGQILSQAVLDIPRIMPINLHASLLPAYRGAAPINWALIKGEKQTGVSVIKMVDKLDAGPLICKKSLIIGKQEDVRSLGDKLSNLAVELLLKALDLIKHEKYTLFQQDETKVSLAPKLKKEDGLIHWSASSEDIFNLVRGCAGWPGAFTHYRGKILKIHKVSLCPPESFSCVPAEKPTGKILQISPAGILVSTASDCILIEQLQVEGKKRISACDFVSGYKTFAGELFGNRK